jgi:endonuclease/exonuclease/phosphatase family metal-dependent hydrolase
MPDDPDPPDAGPIDAGPPPDPSFEVRLATYNVRTSNLDNSAWGDTHVGFDDNDAARMRRIADTVAAQKLTVVAFQELRKPERDAVLARLSSFHGQDWGFTTLVDGSDDALVLFRKSVWSKSREVHYVIPLQPGLSDRNQVGALLQHKSTGREIWIYSVHFASGDSAAAISARAEAAKRTVKSIQDEAVAKKQLFVLAGDFNSTSDENTGDVLRASGLMKYTRNVAAEVVNNGCKSFNGRAGSEGLQVCFGGVASHIDQVWVAKSGVQVLAYKITATQQTSRSSDHNPLTTILKVP